MSGAVEQLVHEHWNKYKWFLLKKNASPVSFGAKLRNKGCGLLRVAGAAVSIPREPNSSSLFLVLASILWLFPPHLVPGPFTSRTPCSAPVLAPSALGQQGWQLVAVPLQHHLFFWTFLTSDLQSPDGGAVTIFLLRCVVAVGGSEVLEAARCCHTVLSAPGAPLRLPSITLSQCLTSSRSISV